VKHKTDEQTDRVQHLMRPPRMVALSITFQYRVNERYTGYATEEQTDRQTHITTTSQAVARIADRAASHHL